MSYVALSVKEYAKLIRQHHDSVYRRIKAGRCKYQVERDGRHMLVLVPRETVERLSGKIVADSSRRQ